MSNCATYKKLYNAGIYLANNLSSLSIYYSLKLWNAISFGWSTDRMDQLLDNSFYCSQLTAIINSYLFL